MQYVHDVRSSALVKRRYHCSILSYIQRSSTAILQKYNCAPPSSFLTYARL
jgi:hypothetical protein